MPLEARRRLFGPPPGYGSRPPSCKPGHAGWSPWLSGGDLRLGPAGGEGTQARRPSPVGAVSTALHTFDSNISHRLRSAYYP